ncbi:NAD(P)/FAD-dependent oxidoreductase [Oceanithermus desulfurans]|uniref:FAD-dependent oxidoreductase n=2 Tax=Oceanithermus desulfurans TaxID=227924 RepID=A0A511RKB5_9DEIN|nr:FAD-binding oxidoreductase [Oceanithermus desulfurans]MBB6030423.1 sarcosine oxidase subunit beta [Oceanithermus desulfurans]GEM89276.1 FAD-dependent oxidoreductase [Oceanithermus desulfurans NBRC 100063]
MEHSYDALIIGAGIVGAAVAYRLAERGLRVAVLEADSVPAAQATAKSAAGVRVQFSEAVNVRLSWASIQEYRTFEEVFGVSSGYRPIGYLFLVPEGAEAAYERALATQKRLGVPVERLAPGEAKKLADFDPDGVAFATWGPADGVIDPHLVAHAYLKAARGRGAELFTETPLLRAGRRGRAWRVETPAGSFTAPVVVNAAGAWAGEVARRAGFELPVEPVRRMVFMTGPMPEARGLPLTVDVATGFYLRGEGERVLFGRSNPEEPPGFREGMDWGWLEPTLEAGLARFPWLERAGLDQRASWWGYYAVTPDHNPILGWMPGVEGWVNAAGFSGHGVQQAAAVGRALAEEVVDGRAHSIEIDPLRYERFERGKIVQEKNIV